MWDIRSKQDEHVEKGGDSKLVCGWMKRIRGTLDWPDISLFG